MSDVILRRRAARLHSCTSAAIVQTIALLAVFVALPILLYGVVRAAEDNAAVGRIEAAAGRTSLIANGLAPALESAALADVGGLARGLARFGGRGTAVHLFFRPAARSDASGVFYVASAVAAPRAAVEADLVRLRNAGMLDRLVTQCDESNPSDAAVVAQSSALLSVARVRSAYGCWGIMTVSPVTAVIPLWTNPALQITALAYVGLALFALASAARLLANLYSARALDMTAADGVPATSEQSELMAGAAHDTAGITDSARDTINLSNVVRTFLEAERNKLGAAQNRLAAEIEDAIVIRGRADYVGAILTELVGGPLGAGAIAHVTLSMAADETRRRALLTVAERGSSGPVGRLSMIKQFVIALGGVCAESREDAGAVFRVAFQA